MTAITRITSSWCIFSGASGDRSYDPIACSSKNYTFENQDKAKIDNMRSWIKTHFNSKNSLVFGREFKLASRNQATPGDNDVLVQVVHKTELDDKVVFFIQDETDGVELHAYKYFNFVETNDVIRIRGFKIFDK